LVKEKKYDSALRIGTEILKDNPNENDVLFIIGGTAYAEDDTIRSESTVISNGTMDTTINSPPPSAISPKN